uniref:Variant surface glycoprotein (VSG, atypical), putative n=1 Tax=Trypanosoma brucei brucei (strain 927/4 GUTat10.1) TaxID=185431 RepID=Q4FKS4_TRYB2|nr:variant surface glycoprotein (VSG, atypical), putative [Trypanosoma brucei brucei TREU927]
MLKIALLIEAYAAVHQTDAETPKSANAYEYGALCTLVNIASRTHEHKENTEDIRDVIAHIAAINISAAGANVSANAIDKAKASYTDLKESDQIKKLCTPETWTFCAEGAKRLKAKKATGEYLEWQTLAEDGYRHPQLIELAATASEILGKLTTQIQPDVTTAINANLKAAILGTDSDDEAATVVPVGEDRNRVCGTDGGGTGTRKAGSALKIDMMCLCGKHSSDGSTGDEACHSESTNKPSTPMTAGTNVQQDWLKLKTQCRKQSRSPPLTPAAISAALENFYSKIAKAKNTDFKKTYVLGNRGGTFTGGCTGDNGANDAKCVQYEGATFANGKAGPAWAEKLRQAEADLAAMRLRQTQLFALTNRALGLNSTVNILRHAPKIHQPPTKQRDVTEKQPTVAEKKACEKYNGNQKECPQEGCTYDEKENKCKPKPGTENTTGTGRKTIEKRKGKLEHECTKAQDCKWESNACKDYSFFLNKKFALVALISLVPF